MFLQKLCRGAHFKKLDKMLSFGSKVNPFLFYHTQFFGKLVPQLVSENNSSLIKALLSGKALAQECLLCSVTFVLCSSAHGMAGLHLIKLIHLYLKGHVHKKGSVNG